MKGEPKHWNTKKDAMVALNRWPTRTKKYLQTFLDGVEKWMIDHKLKDDEEGITDDTHKIREIKDEETGEVTERYQLVWKQDPNCKLFRLGFTTEEVQEIINK